MTGFGTDEPYQNFVEVVDIGTWFNSTPDVRLTYTPSSRDFQVQSGVVKEISTRITVVSDTGSTYTITRHPRGKYEANSWFTWVSRRP